MPDHKKKLAAQRRWYRKNREKVLAWQKIYQQKNHERTIARSREYNSRTENKEKAKQRYRDNREKIRERQRGYERLLTSRFNGGRREARARGLSWGLSFETYTALIVGNQCYYCEGPLSPTGSGLDRADNSMGYEINNVLPCCGDCNAHRLDTWTVEEALVAIRAVTALRKEIVNG